MKLFLVGHAIAESTDTTDALRPLSEVGRKKMRKAANRLRLQIGAIDALVTSPWLRARETAEIIASACGDPTLVECALLAGDQSPEPVIAWLQQYPPTATIVLVGHEPQLGVLTGLLLADSPRPLVRFGKGGAALITFTQSIAVGTGLLQWALLPNQLRALKQDG